MEIEKGCLAEKAGAQAGDCLVELCGETVHQSNHGKLKQLLVAKSVDTTELVIVKVNSVYVIFDKPQTVAAIRLWNYAKTASRGVKEFSVLVDDLLVHSGSLPAVPTHAQGILPTLRPPLQPHLVSLAMAGGREEEEEDGEQGVTSERRRMQQAVANQALRPLTSLTHTQL